MLWPFFCQFLTKIKKQENLKCQHAVDLFHFYTPYNKDTTGEQNENKRNKKSQRAVDQNKKETP